MTGQLCWKSVPSDIIIIIIIVVDEKMNYLKVTATQRWWEQNLLAIWKYT